MKYVYLIQSLENGYYKIGVSKHPQRRLSEHQTGNPSPIKLIETYPTEYAYKIETALKNRYSHVRKNGEWFDLSMVNELTFREECRKVEENLIFMKNSGNVFI